MTKKLLLALLLFTSIYTFAQQDKKWSVEANYPISIGEDLGNDAAGILDLGIKYRFLDLEVMQLGFGLNAGVFSENIRSNDGFGGAPDLLDIDESNWLVQPKVFAEFQIPGLQKLRPSIGLGYAFITSNFDGFVQGAMVSETESEGGLNLNLGLSYDLTKRIFIQAQYDYIRNTFEVPAFPGTTEIKQNLGFLKLGIGFRF